MNRKYCLWVVLCFQISLIECGVTVEQMEKSSAMVRSVCQPKWKVSDESADGIKAGKFPDEKSLKCYIHCILEMTGIMKKNKLNYEAAIKQMDMLLPDDLLEPNKQGITICRESAVGIKDPCEAGFVIVQCMYKNNPKFMFA